MPHIELMGDGEESTPKPEKTVPATKTGTDISYNPGLIDDAMSGMDIAQIVKKSMEANSKLTAVKEKKTRLETLVSSSSLSSEERKDLDAKLKSTVAEFTVTELTSVYIQEKLKNFMKKPR